MSSYDRKGNMAYITFLYKKYETAQHQPTKNEISIK